MLYGRPRNHRRLRYDQKGMGLKCGKQNPRWPIGIGLQCQSATPSAIGGHVEHAGSCVSKGAFPSATDAKSLSSTNTPKSVGAPRTRANQQFQRPSINGQKLALNQISACEGYRLLSRALFKRPLYLAAALPQDGMPDLLTERNALSRCVVDHGCLSFQNAGDLSDYARTVACPFCIAVLRRFEARTKAPFRFPSDWINVAQANSRVQCNFQLRQS